MPAASEVVVILKGGRIKASDRSFVNENFYHKTRTFQDYNKKIRQLYCIQLPYLNFHNYNQQNSSVFSTSSLKPIAFSDKFKFTLKLGAIALYYITYAQPFRELMDSLKQFIISKHQQSPSRGYWGNYRIRTVYYSAC